MGKYNYSLNVDNDNDSRALTLQSIKKNSRVLEFGPANGHLTRVMANNMNCEVHIVEMDTDSGKEASKYASKSLVGEELGNIEKYNWLEEFKDYKYDFITFGDVLEHLYNPKNVLCECKKLLKDDGSIIVSIQNMAHNSIIIDLINDELKYNETGLLDNTHIRFFTYNSFRRLINESGFIIVSEKSTYNPVGYNEIDNNFEFIDNNISKNLKRRFNGDTYQFVFEIKKDIPSNKDIKLKSELKNYLSYYNLSINFKDNNSKTYNDSSAILGNVHTKNINISINTSNIQNINEMQLKPINSNCILTDIDVYYIDKNNKKISLDLTSGNFDLEIDSKYLFTTDSPYLNFDLTNYNMTDIFINYKIEEYDSNTISYFSKTIKALIDEVNTLELNVKQSDNKLNELKNTLNKYFMNNLK